VIGLPRSTFYYRSTARHAELSDEKVAEMINAIQDEFPGYGYRRVTRELATRGACINHKRAARIMRERGLHAVTKRRFVVKPKPGDDDAGVFPKGRGGLIGGL
jgi:putative transposase